MVLAKQRSDVIWNRYNFPISMEGCVLYVPLWQEDTRLSPFLSYDPNHYSCAVTGATWGSTGRTHDGTDDKTVVTMTPPTGAMSVTVWFKVLATDNGAVFSLNNLDTFQTLRIAATVEFKAGTNNNRVWTFDGTDGTWYCLTYTIPGNAQTDINDAVLMVNGTTRAVSTTSTVSATETRNNFSLAKEAVGEYFLNCIVGEAWVHNRVISLPEHQNIQKVTEGMYR